MKKIKRPLTLTLRTETVRVLRADKLTAVAGGLQCTQSCNQCSLYPECGGDTSSTTF